MINEEELINKKKIKIIFKKQIFIFYGFKVYKKRNNKKEFNHIIQFMIVIIFINNFYFNC